MFCGMITHCLSPPHLPHTKKNWPWLILIPHIIFIYFHKGLILQSGVSEPNIWLSAYQRKIQDFLLTYADIELCPETLILLTFSHWVNRTFFLIIFGTKPPQKIHNLIFLPYRKKRYEMQEKTNVCKHSSIVEEQLSEVVTAARFIGSYIFGLKISILNRLNI